MPSGVPLLIFRGLTRTSAAEKAMYRDNDIPFLKQISLRFKALIRPFLLSAVPVLALLFLSCDSPPAVTTPLGEYFYRVEDFLEPKVYVYRFYQRVQGYPASRVEYEKIQAKIEGGDTLFHFHRYDDSLRLLRYRRMILRPRGVVLHREVEIAPDSDLTEFAYDVRFDRDSLIRFQKIEYEGAVIRTEETWSERGLERPGLIFERRDMYGRDAGMIVSVVWQKEEDILKIDRLTGIYGKEYKGIGELEEFGE